MPLNSAERVGQHKHREAFALMWYGCKCGHRERIWNSRDGVTPFGYGCPSCGDVADHIQWQLDEYAPNYEPVRGQRFFRNGTSDEAVAIIEKRIKRFAAQGHEVPADVQEILLASARNGTDEFQPGWPTIDIVA